MHEKGDSVEKNDAEALKCFDKAANKGYVEAQYNLGSRYMEGKTFPQDYDKAYEWLEKAAEQGYLDAQYDMYHLCLLKLSTCDNFAQENTSGICSEGSSRYNEGEKAPEGQEKMAYTWLEKAANNGHALAQYELGRRYYYGDGFPAVPEKARYWLQQAADQGHMEAKNLLEFIL